MRELGGHLVAMLIGLLLLALGIYAGFAAHLYLTQDEKIFFPETVIQITPDQIGLPYDEVKLPSSDGVTLHGWYVIAAAKPRATVLYLHGNAGNIGNCLESVKQLVLLGMNVLVIDYRGYGGSTGKPSEQGLYDDAEAAWRYLIDTRKADPQKVVVYGQSLGGAVAAWLAAKHTPGALILEAAFTSLPDSAAERYPWLPVRWLARYRFDTLTALDKVFCPVLVVHSVDDEVTSYRHALKLYDAAGASAVMLDLQGTHNGAVHESLMVFTRGVDNFLTRYMPP